MAPSTQMLERMDKTLEGVRETISQIQENERNIDNMKKYFGEVMEKLAYKLADSLQGNPLKYLPLHPERSPERPTTTFLK